MKTLAAFFLCFCSLAWAQDKSVMLYTSLAPSESGPIGRAFEKKTGIKVQVWRALSEKVVQRALAERQATRFAVDVIETHGPEMEVLAREGLLAPIDSPYIADLPPAAIPKHRQWVPDRVNFFVVAYNTSQVDREDLPLSYQGFLDPRWRGRIGIEATGSEWMGALVKKWGEAAGMAYFRRLAEMRPDVRKGHVLLAERIVAGEIAVGLTVYNANAESFKRRGAPIDWVPVQPVVARAQGIGIARDAPHAQGAAAFVDFVLSPEGQQLLASMGGVPVSTKVRTHMNQFDYTLVESAAVLEEQEKWQKEWERLFLVK